MAGASLPDGRLIAATGLSMFLETAPGSGVWRLAGTLPAVAEPTFVAVSPSGSRVAIGMNPAIVVVDVSALGGRGGTPPALGAVGSLLNVSHYDGAWIDEHRLALTATGGPGLEAPVGVVLEVTLQGDGSASTRVIVTNIGGASAGVGIDAVGNLYTGNGFDLIAGGSDTGWIKAFSPGLWASAPADFEDAGVLVCDLLSAGGLRFDAEGNLFVGGGDFGAGDTGYVGIISAMAIESALLGGSPVNPSDPGAVRRLTPTPDPFAFYGVIVNAARGEALVTNVDFGTNLATWHRSSGVFVLPGDANGDHEVDFEDLNIVLGAFGTAGGGGAAAGDLNGDGRVDFLDLNIVLSAFGSVC